MRRLFIHEKQLNSETERIDKLLLQCIPKSVIAELRAVRSVGRSVGVRLAAARDEPHGFVAVRRAARCKGAVVAAEYEEVYNSLQSSIILYNPLCVRAPSSPPSTRSIILYNPL